MKKIFLFIILTITCSHSQVLWEQIDFPSKVNLYTVFFTDSITGWVGCDSGYVFHTKDGGMSWEKQNTNSGVRVREIQFINDSVGWMLQRQDVPPPFGTYIFSTVDGGVSWDSTEYPDETIYAVTFNFLDSLKGFIGGDYIAYTETGGLDWKEAEVDSFLGFKVHNFTFFDNRYGFACGGHVDVSGIIWKTNDGGMRWQGTAVSPEPINMIRFIDSSSAIGVGGDFEFGSSVVTTKDSGNSWQYHFLEVLGIARSISFRSEKEAWVQLHGVDSLLFSIDSGLTWRTYPVPDNRLMNDLVFIDSTYGYACGDSGVFLKYVPFVSSLSFDDEIGITNSALLSQNYPNPFNPVTTIKYNVKSSGAFTSLKIYDILGNEIKVLVDNFREAGEYEVQFDASELPSGIYFYQIKSGNFIDRKKMILLR